MNNPSPIRVRKPIWIGLLVVGLLITAVIGIVNWFHNQAGDVAAGCHLQMGACVAAIPGGGTVQLKLSPKPIAFHVPLEIHVDINGLAAENVEVDFSGVTEPTSYNRAVLRTGDTSGHFYGVSRLSVCMPTNTDWQATVLIGASGQRVAVPFLFNTDPKLVPKSPVRTELSEPPGSGDFILSTADGPMTFRQIRQGKFMVVAFSYLDAPSACAYPLTVATQAMAQLNPNERKRVQGLYISLDPEKDTPQRLKEHLSTAHPAFVGATGADADLIGAARLFGVAFTRHTGIDGHLDIHHMAQIYLVAPDGSVVGQYSTNDPAQLATDIRRALAAQPIEVNK